MTLKCLVWSPGEGAVGFLWRVWKGKQWFHSVSVWYLVGEMEVEGSSVNLLQTNFAASVNPVCFI